MDVHPSIPIFRPELAVRARREATSGRVLAPIGDELLVYRTTGAPVGGLDENVRIELVTGDGDVRTIARLRFGMAFVGHHAIVEGGRVAFVTDDRLVHVIDLATAAIVLCEQVRADRVFSLLEAYGSVWVNMIVDDVGGPRSMRRRLDVRAGTLAPPEAGDPGLGHRRRAEHILPRACPPGPARRLPAPPSPSVLAPLVHAEPSFIVPIARTYGARDRLGPSGAEVLATMARRHRFTPSSLFYDTVVLSLEEPSFRRRLARLGLTLEGLPGWNRVLPGLDPSVVVFGELRSHDPTPVFDFVGFYMYPERNDENQVAIVVVDAVTHRVRWRAPDFDAFFGDFLVRAEAVLPSTVDTVLTLLGRATDEMEYQRTRLAVGAPASTFLEVHGVGPTLEVGAGHDPIARERAVVRAIASGADLDAWIDPLASVYRTLGWEPHLDTVRRWRAYVAR